MELSGIKAEIENNSDKEADNVSISEASDDFSMGAIKKLAKKSTMLGQIASATTISDKDSYEPLPFTDSTLLDDNYGTFFLLYDYFLLQRFIFA